MIRQLKAIIIQAKSTTVMKHFSTWNCFYNKLVWALNWEHLHYLIHYLSADLREKPFSTYTIMKTQADHLPTFMKIAKNRKGIVKALEKIQ